jgi:hypothetical protein
MNNVLEGVDGFKDWKNTFYYSDTDSMILPSHVFESLKQNTNMIGKRMGQLHDDLDLEGAKIIDAIFISPKMYWMKYVGYNDNNEVETRTTIKCKGLPYANRKDLNKESFLQMLNGEEVTACNIRQFKRVNNHKQYGIRTVYSNKTINQTSYEGKRLESDGEYRCLPFRDEECQL